MKAEHSRAVKERDEGSVLVNAANERIKTVRAEAQRSITALETDNTTLQAVRGDARVNGDNCSRRYLSNMDISPLTTY